MYKSWEQTWKYCWQNPYHLYMYMLWLLIKMQGNEIKNARMQSIPLFCTNFLFLHQCVPSVCCSLGQLILLVTDQVSQVVTTVTMVTCQCLPLLSTLLVVKIVRRIYQCFSSDKKMFFYWFSSLFCIGSALKKKKKKNGIHIGTCRCKCPYNDNLQVKNLVQHVQCMSYLVLLQIKISGTLQKWLAIKQDKKIIDRNYNTMFNFL